MGIKVELKYQNEKKNANNMYGIQTKKKKKKGKINNGEINQIKPKLNHNNKKGIVPTKKFTLRKRTDIKETIVRRIKQTRNWDKKEKRKEDKREKKT